MKRLKRWVKPVIQLLMRRLGRLGGYITAPQFEAVAHRVRELAEEVEELRAQMYRLLSPATAIESTASRGEAMAGRLPELTEEVDDLRSLVRYLLLPDSEGYQRLLQKDTPAYACRAMTPQRRASPSPAPSAGKPLRILHIGNIANNAYLNARILNEAGFDCDVLCYNYYHIMGSPEWEDADFTGTVDDAFPAWNMVDLQGFQRPRWFAQGLLQTCVDYLYARRKKQVPTAASLWSALNSQSTSLSPNKAARLLSLSCEPHVDEAHYERLLRTFAEVFPERYDQLQRSDLDYLKVYTPDFTPLKILFAEYDIVQGYATDPIWPLLTGKRPYVAFEHGTIRSIPFEDTPVGRLTAFAYHQADGVIITNGDNNYAAEQLKLADYRFIPHPVNETWIQQGLGHDLREQLRQDLDADFLVLHPARQHWDVQRHPSWEKGNDIFIEGLARFIQEVAPRAAAIFIEWGQKVHESKELLASLGVAKRVKWIPLQHNCGLSRYVDACDLVADQFFLGAFGNIMPKALAQGKPAILYVDEARHRWCFPEMPPVINARTPNEVYVGLRRAYQERTWLQELSESGRRWYNTYHSNAIICKRLVTLYQDVLSRYHRQT